MLLEFWCHWNNASGTRVMWCTSWCPWLHLHRNWGMFDFDRLFSIQLIQQSGRWENHRERNLWTVQEEFLLWMQFQIDHHNRRHRNLWVYGILTGTVPLLLCMPPYRDDLGNVWMLVLLKRNLSGKICYINLYLQGIWEHEQRPCNVEDVENCCMRK